MFAGFLPFVVLLPALFLFKLPQSQKEGELVPPETLAWLVRGGGVAVGVFALAIAGYAMVASIPECNRITSRLRTAFIVSAVGLIAMIGGLMLAGIVTMLALMMMGAGDMLKDGKL